MIKEIDTNHKTVNIPLKTIEVDEGIVPVVNWLNGMNGVFTMYSCQGQGPNEDGIYCPAYVMFVCRKADVLADIKKTLTDFMASTIGHCYLSLDASIEREGDILFTNFNFVLDHAMLPAFIDFLGTRNEKEPVVSN